MKRPTTHLNCNDTICFVQGSAHCFNTELNILRFSRALLDIDGWRFEITRSNSDTGTKVQLSICATAGTSTSSHRAWRRACYHATRRPGGSGDKKVHGLTTVRAGSGCRYLSIASVVHGRRPRSTRQNSGAPSGIWWTAFSRMIGSGRARSDSHRTIRITKQRFAGYFFQTHHNFIERVNDFWTLFLSRFEVFLYFFISNYWYKYEARRNLFLLNVINDERD